MAIPSAIKITKNGVQYIDQVDRTKYTLKELVHAANKDVGKYITRKAKETIRRHSGRGHRNTQYWARKDGSLIVGYKKGGFFIGYQEIGTSKKVKKEHIQNAILNNKDEIRKIQGTYIKSIEDENRAKGLIDEREETGSG